MNKVFIAVLTIATVILIVLISFVNVLQRKPSESETGNSGSIQPTPFQNNRSGSMSQSRIPTLSPQEIKNKFITLNDEQLNSLSYLQTKLQQPVENKDFEIEYSDLLHRFFVNKLTDNADEELQKYFNNDSISSLYIKNNEYGLFHISNRSSLNNEKSRVEEEFEKEREKFLNDIFLEPPTPTITDSRPTEQQKQINALSGLFGIMSNFSIPTPAPTISRTSTPTTLPPSGDQTAASYGSDALNKIITEASQKVGTPTKIIKAVMRVECPLTFKLSDTEVDLYSQPGKGVPFCVGKPPYYDSGSMQFITTTWPYYANSVNVYGGYAHKPYVMNIRDSVYAGAVLLKKASKTSTADNWSYQEVLRTITCYNAGCAKYPNNISDKVMRYFNRVWNEYNQR